MLLPAFKKAHPEYDPRVVAPGARESLELGKLGDADVLLVDSPADEELFMKQKRGIVRVPAMHNYFAIVGPKTDPAGIYGVTDPIEAVSRVAISGAPFISRGDGSGAFKMEQELWKAAGIAPKGDWYISADQRTSEVLTIASEEQGYTITDLGSFISASQNLELARLVEKGPGLINLYSVIVPRRTGNLKGANDFTEWLTSSKGRTIIGLFGRKRFGQSLFAPGWPVDSGSPQNGSSNDSSADDQDGGAHTPSVDTPEERRDLPGGHSPSGQ